MRGSDSASHATRVTTGLLVGASLLAVLGCNSSEAGSAATTTLRDSAGIQIVEHTGTEGVEAPWQVRDRPVFRTGWRDDEPAFEFIIHGRIGEDGRILVTDANAQTLYLLSAEGEVLQTLGRQGEGPGEFGLTVDASVFGGGDTIYAQDGSALSTFVGGQVLRDEVAPWGWRVGAAGLTISTRRSDGRLVLLPTLIGGARYGEREWVAAPTVAMDPRHVDRLDTLFEADFFQLRQRGESRPVPLYGMAAARGDFLAHGRVDRPEVRWYDPVGSLSRIARWDPASLELTEDDWEVYEEARRGLSSPEMNSERTARSLRDAREVWGGPKPAFKWLNLDSEGNLWLSHYTPS